MNGIGNVHQKYVSLANCFILSAEGDDPKENIGDLYKAFDLIENCESRLLFAHLKKKLQVLNEYLLQGNEVTPTVIAAAITSQKNKAKLPTHIELTGPAVGLTKDSIVLLEQVRTIDKRRLREHMGRVDSEMMGKIDNAIAVSFGLQG